MTDRRIHWVGTKDRKSLALIIPAHIHKEQNLNASTGFALRVDDTKIVLQVINTEPVMISADRGFEAYQNQHLYLR